MWIDPAAMAVIPLPRPVTSTGVLLLTVVPSPNCPKLSFPQHLTPLPETRAQVWYPPAATIPSPVEAEVYHGPGRRITKSKARVAIVASSLSERRLPKHETDTYRV